MEDCGLGVEFDVVVEVLEVADCAVGVVVELVDFEVVAARAQRNYYHFQHENTRLTALFQHNGDKHQNITILDFI